MTISGTCLKVTVIQSNSCKEKETMKMKKRMMKMAAMMMAMTMVMGSAMTVHASSDCDDGCVRDEGVGYGDAGGSGECYFDFGDAGSSDSGSSSSSESSSSSAGSSHSGSSSSSESSSHSGSSNYDDGCVRDEGVGYGDAGGSGECSFDNGSSDNGGTSYSAPARKAPGSNTGVTGKEQFRALAKSGEGSYKVTHKGQTIATFWLVDAEGKSVPCTAVALKQRSDDKKWAINFEVADSEGLNIGAPLDRTYMFKTLGVSYVTINDAVIIDIEAEAQAATTK